MSLHHDQVVDVRGYLAGTAILTFVSVHAEPLVLAYANGFSSAGVVTPITASRPETMKRVHSLCGAIVSATLYLPFMVGQYSSGAMLFTAVDAADARLQARGRGLAPGRIRTRKPARKSIGSYPAK